MGMALLRGLAPYLRAVHDQQSTILLTSNTEGITFKEQTEWRKHPPLEIIACVRTSESVALVKMESSGTVGLTVPDENLKAAKEANIIIWACRAEHL
jgi:hypothetical protein